MNHTCRAVLVVVLVLIALPLLWGGTMMGGGMGPGMMRGWNGWDGSWSPWGATLGMLPMVLVIGIVGTLVLWASAAFSQSPPAPPPGPSGARDILDARYARGEITREQYQQMRDDLKA